MITANMFFNRMRYPGDVPIGSWEAYRQLVIVPELGVLLIREQGYDEGPPLKAYINHGKWLVKCECGGCEKVWEEGWMMCRACLNTAHGHRYRQTVFPRIRKAIEMLLIQRPLANRNWQPGETLVQLKAENKIHKEELLG